MSTTIWAQANPTGVTGYSTTTETDSCYSLDFTVATAGTINGIWFYSPASPAGALPSAIGLYNSQSQGLLVSNTSPSWSGADGAGWVFATLPTYSLVPGTHYLAEYLCVSSTGQAYLYTGGGGAGVAWFPSTSADGNITAGLDDYYGHVQASYANSVTVLTFPNTFNGNNLNWLLDVDISFASAGGPVAVAYPRPSSRVVTVPFFAGVAGAQHSR